MPHAQREWFRAVVDKVAMVPVFMEHDGTVEAESERAVRLIGSSIAKRLRRSGVRTLRYTAWSKCWNRAAERYGGGLFDPKTGRPVKERYDRAFDDCAGELAERSDISAVVYPRLETVPAPTVSHHVRWHGAEQDLRSFG